jgi:hypothetical protein
VSPDELPNSSVNAQVTFVQNGRSRAASRVVQAHLRSTSFDYARSLNLVDGRHSSTESMPVAMEFPRPFVKADLTLVKRPNRGGRSALNLNIQARKLHVGEWTPLGVSGAIRPICCDVAVRERDDHTD